MTTIGKTAFLTYEGKVMACKDKHIFHFTKPKKANIFFAALTVQHTNHFGKVGITHIAHGGEVLDEDILADVLFYVFRDGIDICLFNHL